MIKYILLSFIVLSFAGWSQDKKLTPAQLKSFKERVSRETSSLTSIRTDFKQSKHLEFLSNDIESEGKMFLNAEGNLKWAYTSPNKYSVIFKDNSILINDNGKKNTISGNQEMFKKINHLIAGSVSGKLFDDKAFDIEYFKVDKHVLVKLKPKDKTLEKYMSEVRLFFPEKEATVSKVKLIEPSGDYTLITFINKELNVSLDPYTFEH